MSFVPPDCEVPATSKICFTDDTHNVLTDVEAPYEYVYSRDELDHRRPQCPAGRVGAHEYQDVHYRRCPRCPDGCRDPREYRYERYHRFPL